MTGYLRQAAVYVLAFHDDEYEGLEVRATSVPMGRLLAMSRLADRLQGLRPAVATPEQLDEVDQLLEQFATALKSWNVELPEVDDDGKETGKVVAVPASLAGLKRLDWPFVYDIVIAWIRAGTTVDEDLGKDSSSGELEASLPMEVLQPSPSS